MVVTVLGQWRDIQGKIGGRQSMGAFSGDLQQAVAAAAAAYQADIISLFGPIYPPIDEELVRVCGDRVHRRNLLIMLATRGGNPHAAYRIARCFQRYYKDGRIIVLVDAQCESAGTLIALGADELVMSEAGYLGPLDVQVRKIDEVGEMGSALTADQALETLRQETAQYVTDHFLKMRFGQEVSMTTRQAADLAVRLAIGCFKPVYAQIDPMRLGEINRSVRIASEYARRIGRNLKRDAISTLVTGYPSHLFVIDRDEATQLFNVVRPPSQDLMLLCDLLRDDTRSAVRSGKASLRFLSFEERQARRANGLPTEERERDVDPLTKEGSNGRKQSRTDILAKSGESSQPKTDLSTDSC
jgi:Serine dehydrogenase proteinase